MSSDEDFAFSDNPEELPEGFQETFSNIVKLASNYGTDASSQDVIRELMQESDDLLSTYREKTGTIPDCFETLDDTLWQWFQEPPSPPDFKQKLSEFLEQIFEEIQTSESNEDQTGETGSTDDIDPSELDDLDYRGLQELAKQRGIPANQSTDELIQALADANDDNKQKSSETTEPAAAENLPGSEITEATLEIELDVDTDILEDFLTEAEEQLNTLENMMVEVEGNPDSESLNELYRAMHTLKGGFGFCNLHRCTELTHGAEDLLDVLREDVPENVPASWMDLLLAAIDVIRVILSALQTAVEESKTILDIDVSPQYLEHLGEDFERAVQGTRDRAEFRSFEVESSLEDQEDELDSNMVKVELEEIGNVVDLVGELVISHSELKEKMNGQMDREILQSLNNQEKIMNQLQRRSMNMRMLPMKREFRKYPRTVRDLSRKMNKEVDLEIRGEQTELDKSVLDNLEGPLMHLVRNAVDHGLETPEERKKKGKPKQGKLEIRAYHESGHVYIEIEDDGRGLPTDQIEEKAIEKNLIEEDHSLTEERIHDQILQPGFSTADEVTDVSGRGVGMDVVATEIENLRGNVLLDSEKDKGTRVTLELPLTVAIIDGLITRIGNERFIFPVNQVEESINPDPNDVDWMQGTGRVVRFRDHVVPVIDPGKLIGGVDRHETINERTIMVVVRQKDEQYAVWIDELLAHEQIVIKQIDSPEVEDVDLTAGGAILGDGHAGLILDILGMIRCFKEKTDQQASKQSQLGG